MAIMKMDFEDFEAEDQGAEGQAVSAVQPAQSGWACLERGGTAAHWRDICLASWRTRWSAMRSMVILRIAGHHQTVFASLGEAVCNRIAVICTAPSKTFNLAGLQVSNIFVPDPELRRQFKRDRRCGRLQPAEPDGADRLSGSL